MFGPATEAVASSMSLSSLLAGDPPHVECRDYHQMGLNATQLCHFMRSTENCHTDDGFVDYLIFAFCQFRAPDSTWLAMILLSAWLFILFVGLGIVADTFFCPSLRTIADSMKLSQNIAGVTFLAFGNGAPDVFSAIAAIGNSKDGDSGLAFGALFGAGVFVSTVIVGCICFIQPFHSVQRPLLRDIIFFMISTFWAFVVVWDGKIALWETLGFLFLYVVYICVVIFGRLINQKIKLSKGILTKNDFTKNVGIDSSSRAKSLKSIQDSYNGEDDRSDSEDIEGQRRPLLSQEAAINEEGEDEKARAEDELVSYKSELRASCWPVDMAEWRESNLFNKAMIVVKTPVFYLLKMSIPLVDYDIAKSNWNKSTIMINCLVAPIFMVLATQVAGSKLFDIIPVWLIAIILGVTLALLVFFFTELQNEPKFYWIFAYFGFAVSIVWIYTIANEIVNLLTTFGVVLNISNTILGLTFLAWGNSLSDLVANAASARRGFPNMGISACFGGPLFNILLGVGIPFTFQCLADGDIEIKKSFLQDVLAGFVFLSLVLTIVFIPCNNFYFSRRYGICMIALYVVFLVTCILVESKVIKSPFDYE